MAGTRAGGLKTAALVKSKYGEDYYVKQGMIGGKLGDRTRKGFGTRRELAVELGRKGGIVGGRLGKPGRKLIKITPTKLIYTNLKTGEKETYPNENND